MEYIINPLLFKYLYIFNKKCKYFAVKFTANIHKSNFMMLGS